MYARNDSHKIMMGESDWLKSCYLVSPLTSCNYPSGLKLYTSKHSISLAMLFKMYDIIMIKLA